MTDRAQLQISRRKTQDRAAILAIVGTVLLLPPFAQAALVDADIAGVPVTLAYVFAVWIGLVAGAAYLARPLTASDETNATPDPEGTGA